MNRKLIALISALALLSTAARAQVVGNGNLTWIPITCTTTSTPFGINANQYLTVNIPVSGGTVWFGWGFNQTTGAPNPATTAPPSQSYAGGTTGSTIQWGAGTGSCITASGTQTISVGYK